MQARFRYIDAYFSAQKKVTVKMYFNVIGLLLLDFRSNLL